MRGIKKLSSLLLAMMLAAAMVLPAMAAGETTTINIKGGISGAQYAAYRLLDLEVSSGSNQGGTPQNNYKYTVTDKYEAVLKAAVNAAKKQPENTDISGGDIVKYIEGLQDEGTEIRTLADDIYRRIRNAGLTPDSTTTNDTFSNVPQGYYMIAETKPGNAQDAYSLVMLGTAGKENATISTKESVPTVEKKVKEYNDTTATQTDWQDAADYDIGDSVPFQLTGTLPKDLSGYSRYTYIFHDTLSKGLTYNNDAKIYLVTGSEENEVTVNPEMGGAQTFKITPVKNASTGETDISFECLMTKGLAQMPNPEQSKIVIRYTATLNEAAVIGSAGNPNTVYLEYSNNPYVESETANTTIDKVTVFTYKLVVNKVQGDGKTPLDGAGFTLYKADKAGNYNPYGSELKGGTTFNFTGLDEGSYKLVETTIPTGYHAADDLYFTITSEYEVESTDPRLTSLTTDSDAIVVDSVTGAGGVVTYPGTMNTTVANETGTILPSTGSMGTKAFTLFGAVMMIAGGVWIVVRKRMAEAE